MLERDIQEVLFSEEQLKKRVQEIAGEIQRDYAGKEIMLISVLRGSFIFMADLCRAIDLPCTLDFMAVSPMERGPRPADRFRLPRICPRTSRAGTSLWWRTSWTAGIR